MPNFDKTGPRGKGPKTGRGLGDCTGPIKTNTNKPLRKGSVGGRVGRSRGTGMGRGRNA